MVAGAGFRRPGCAGVSDTLTPRGALLLAALAGFVDTATFIELHGLFAAHVTGNFVLIGAALAMGTGGILAKLLTFPVFVLAIVATQLATRRMASPTRPLLIAQAVLLVCFWAGTSLLAPFAHADDPWLMLVAGFAVAAMGVQNAMMRTAWPSAPPTTIMTGNTTGAVLDLTDWAQGKLAPEGGARLARALRTLAAFATGCALAALCLASLGPVSLILPALALGLLIAGRV